MAWTRNSKSILLAWVASPSEDRTSATDSKGPREIRVFFDGAFSADFDLALLFAIPRLLEVFPICRCRADRPRAIFSDVPSKGILRTVLVKSGQTRKEKASSPGKGNEAWVLFAEAVDHGNHGSREHFSDVKRPENTPIHSKGQAVATDVMRS
jgi:hypothetical protein